MIRFLSLFLGLVYGELPMALEVSDEVARVELRLDGRAVAELTAPPWQVRVDVGPDLLPHELLAVAYGAGGEQLAEETQWLNFGRELVEARLVFDAGSDRRRVRLDSWSFDGERPQKVVVRFDGSALRSGDARFFDLPAHDLELLHLLEAELEFPNGLSARAEMSFGGVYGDVESSDLTALALELPVELAAAGAAEMAGWFEAAGRVVRVHAVDREQPLVAVVRDRRLPANLPVGKGEETSRESAELRFRSRDELVLFSTVPLLLDADGRRTAIFPGTYIERLPRGIRLLDILRKPASKQFARPALQGDRVRGNDELIAMGAQQVFDAAAAAGKSASASGRPRVVVLLVHEQTPAEGVLSWRRVRGFLDALRVPVVVWTYARSESVSRAHARWARGAARREPRTRVVGPEGIEPPTVWLKASCSTD